MKIYGNITKGKDWLDFSSLSQFMKCPRAYYWRSRQDITPTASAIYFTNGKAYHKAKAIYYNMRKEGIDHDLCVVKALDAGKLIMLEIKNPDDKRNISVYIETMLNYMERWREDGTTTIDAEIGFAVDLGEFMFVGAIDRIVKNVFGTCIEETKTTTVLGSKWQSRGKPNLQIDGYVSAYYILTGEMPFGGVLDIIPVPYRKVNSKSTTLQDPFRIITSRTLKDVAAWQDNVQSWWEVIKKCNKNSIFPQNTEACNPVYGMSCDYLQLCNKYLDPWNEAMLEIGDEYAREKWVPFEELNIGEKNANTTCR